MNNNPRTASFTLSNKDHEWLYIFAQAAICQDGVRLDREASGYPYEIVLEVDERKFVVDQEKQRIRGVKTQTSFRQCVEKLQNDIQIMEQSGFFCSKAVIPALTERDGDYGLEETETALFIMRHNSRDALAETICYFNGREGLRASFSDAKTIAVEINRESVLKDKAALANKGIYSSKTLQNICDETHEEVKRLEATGFVVASAFVPEI